MTTIKPRSKGTMTKKRGATAKRTKKVSVAPDQRIEMIREKAYYRAESRGFTNGNPEQDWIDAEAEVDQLLGA